MKKFDKLEKLYNENRLCNYGSNLFKDMVDDGVEMGDVFVDIWMEGMLNYKRVIEEDIEKMIKRD